MTRLLAPPTAVTSRESGGTRPDEAHLAAASFLARYSGRTQEAYRYDLRYFVQWANDGDLDVPAATRGHLEMYRTAMEQRGLAASTIDRRLSTVCGYYRFAHLDGRITSNPAQHVRRRGTQPSEGRGLDHSELARFLFTAEHYDHAHAALAVLLGLNGPRVCEACATNIDGLAFEHGHRTLRIVGKGNKPALLRRRMTGGLQNPLFSHQVLDPFHATVEHITSTPFLDLGPALTIGVNTEAPPSSGSHVDACSSESAGNRGGGVITEG